MAERATSATLMLIDLSSLAYLVYHTSTQQPDPAYVSREIVARVTAIARDYPHCAVCCDSGKSFRHDVDPTYKANRPDREYQAELQHKMRVACDELKAKGFPVWAAPGFEADDVIATAAAKFDGPVVIVSADKDLLQLVTERVTAQSPKDGSRIDAAAVQVKFGVTPAQMLDYLSLVGDASDNIKGAKGIGEKTAAKLLQQFGSIDNIDIETQTNGVKNSLVEFAARRSDVKALLTLRTDAPIPFEEIAAERTTPVSNITEEHADMDEKRDVAEATWQVNAPAVAPSQALTPVVVEENFERALEPRSLSQAMELAKALHVANRQFATPEMVLAVIIAGRELGWPAMVSLRLFHNIDGKLTMSAAGVSALVLKSGKAQYFRCIERTDERATYETRRGDDPPVTLTFTVAERQRSWAKKTSAWTDDETRAWANSGWSKNPADMCVARASSKLARLVYPDVVGGLYDPSEFE